MKIDIISGFLGAGKTTFINSYLPLLDGNLALIENEFGDTSIDSGLIQGDIPMKEIFAGCICCTLRGDFATGIKEVYESYKPDRIIVEPSGVGRLSDVVNGIRDAGELQGISLEIYRLIVLVDVDTFEDFSENFGPFYLDQIENAGLIFLTQLDGLEEEDIHRVSGKIRQVNPTATIVSSDYRDLDKDTLVQIIESSPRSMPGQEDSTRAIPGNKVFSTFTIDSKDLTEEDVRRVLELLEDKSYGQILRVKGYIESSPSRLVNYTPNNLNITEDQSDQENKLVIIGANLNEKTIRRVFKKKIKVGKKAKETLVKSKNRRVKPMKRLDRKGHGKVQ